MTEHMHDGDGAAVAEWNPLARRDPVTRTLKTSGGRASITCQPWSGRERLAYEDAMTVRMLAEDERGEDTVKIGTLRLFAMSLTIIGSSGFPKRADGTDMFTGGAARVEADLLSIGDPKVYDEIRDIALEVQPLPKADNAPSDDEGDGEGSDPSPTPSTPPTANDGAAE